MIDHTKCFHHCFKLAWRDPLYLLAIRGSGDILSIYYPCQSLPSSLTSQPSISCFFFNTFPRLKVLVRHITYTLTYVRTGSHLKVPPATFKRISHHILCRLNLSFSWPRKCASISKACKFIHGQWRPGFQTKSSTLLITSYFPLFPSYKAYQWLEIIPLPYFAWNHNFICKIRKSFWGE